MERIHLRLYGMLIIGAYILKISATEMQHEEDFQHFSLYSFTTDGESWGNAYDACYSEGLQLAVLDKQDQDLIDTWDGLRKENGDHAWIAGRRLGDSGWMWVNGDVHTGISFSDYPIGRCGIIQGGWLKDARCVVELKSELRRGLCQKQTGQRSLTSDTFTSWFAARMECRSQPGRDLAHAHISEGDKEFVDDPDIAKMAAVDSSRGVWVGVCQNCWSWVTGDQTSHQPMNYYHFVRGQGSGMVEDCLHLELGGESPLYWADKACDSPGKYFLCEQRQTTAECRISDPQATPGTVGGSPSTTPEVPSKQAIILSAVVPAVVVVAVIVVVSVLVIKKRQKTKRSGSQSRNPRKPLPPTHGDAEVVNPHNLGSEGSRSLHDQTADLQYPGPQLAVSNGDNSDFRWSQVRFQDVEPYASLETTTMYESLGPRGQPESEGERHTATAQARQPLAATDPEDGTGPYLNVLGDTGAGTEPYVNVLGDTGAGTEPYVNVFGDTDLGTEPYVNVAGPQTNGSIGDNGGRPMEQRDYYNLP